MKRNKQEKSGLIDDIVECKVLYLHNTQPGQARLIDDIVECKV